MKQAFHTTAIALLLGFYVTVQAFAQETAIEITNSGMAKENAHDPDGAIADFNRAIALDPKYAKAYNCRGIARFDKHDLEGAVADYNRAIELDPKYTSPFINRANARGAKGDMDGAIADYSRAIEIDPKKQ